MALAYIIDRTGYISIACFEDGEYWTGSHKHDMSKVRVATDEEVAADDAARQAKYDAIIALERSFGITNHGPNGRCKQPEAYAKLDAYYAKQG